GEPGLPRRGLYPHCHWPRLLVGGAGARLAAGRGERAACRQGERHAGRRRAIEVALHREEADGMTYCVGLDLKDGIVLLSDTRTNAGIDHVSTFGKMHVFEVAGERVIALLTAGNLALSQAVVNLLKEGIESDGAAETLYTVPSMFRAAQLVGAAIRHVYRIDGPALQAQNVSFDISILLGGQLNGRSMRLFQVYPAGNFIEATPDTPFLQIGEHKYGKPILD